MPLEKTQRLEGGRRTREAIGANRPLVSIIVVLFRDRQECIRLLDNISTFENPQLEWIVIDGASDDGTLEVLQQWDDKIDHWLSEPDSGIYDAMNKGVRASTGQWLNFMNVKDAFATPDTIQTVVDKYLHCGARFIYSDDCAHPPNPPVSISTVPWQLFLSARVCIG